MSGIAGITNFDGAPVTPEAIRAMLDAQAYRGPDKRGVWVESSVGIGHDLLRTVPEADHETQPFSLDQSVWITADGRLDNRDDIIRALRRTSCEPLDGVPDCYLMLLAYQQWGEDFAAHLIGDFALAIWDGCNRRLLCAVDALAVRSLYYTVNGQQFIFGSSIGAVLAMLREQPAPNEVFIAQFLTWTLLDGRTATFYEGIQRLAPCHLLIAENGRTRQKKYFEFGTGGLIRYASDREYVDQYRELLEQALIARLRSNTGVTLQLSGGLDSSSLVVLADQLIEAGRLNPAISLTALCVITSEYPGLDERVYQDAVLEQCKHITPDFLSTDAVWGLQSFGADDGHPYHQPEPHPVRAGILHSANRVRELGNRVVITGNGSDELNGRFHGYSAFGPFRDLALRDQIAEWPHFHRRNSMRSLIFRSYVAPALRPLVCEKLKLARYKRQINASYPHLNQHWLCGTYRSSASDREFFEPDLPTRAAMLAYESILGGWESVWRACTDTSASFAQVEMRHPFMDRRLIDFMLRVPTMLLIRRGWDKWILREAAGEHLPHAARYRTGNAHGNALISTGLRDKEKRRLADLVAHSRSVQQGWARQGAWEDAWNQYWDSMTESYNLLAAGVNVERWLCLYEKEQQAAF